MRPGLLPAGLLWLALLAGCVSRGPEEGPLVEVGEEGIAAADFREYRDRLPESYRSPGGEDGVRQLLQALVDREIMVLEAERLGYHEDPEFRARRRRLTVERLVQEVQHDEFGGDLRVTGEEIRRIYQERHWNRRILPAHIVCASQEEAREVIRLLDEGRDFHELARERSLAADAAGGGFLDQYFAPGDAMGNLVEGVYGLPVGAYTPEPLKTNDGWEVVKVLDEEEVSLEQVRPRLARAAHREKFLALRREFVARLQEKSGPGETGASGSGRAAPESLLVAEARSRGMDRSPEYRQFERSLYERMLITLLRRRQVLENIPVSEEEVESAYRQEREEFRLPARVQGTRLLVGSAEQGRDVAGRLRAGEEPEVVARELGLTLGHIHIPETDPAYRRFTGAGAGDVVGPVEVKSRFEVLHVDALTPGRMRPLEEVRHMVRHRLRLRRINEAFETYIRGLRSRYEGEVTWHDDRIRRLAEGA